MRLKNVPGARETIDASAFTIPEPEVWKGRWQEVFGRQAPLHIEIGMGKGQFLTALAAEHPDINYIGIEKFSSVLVRAVQKQNELELPNLRLIRMDADSITDVFSPGEVDRIYLNFSDPWPGNRHAKRRLTHGNFLKLYRQVLKDGGQIHFKTDNQPLFEFSVDEIPQFGFTLSEVTRNLHENGPVGVMTDYEAKFYELGQPINRLVATMVPWEEPFPTDFRRVKNRWLDTFADEVSEADLGQHVLAEGNYLWHIFSWKLVPCLEGDEARKALAERTADGCFRFYCEYPPAGVPQVAPVTAEEIAALPEDLDWYLVDKDFTWTYVHTHEADCGPYFCKPIPTI